jgi:hypothetical protein
MCVIQYTTTEKMEHDPLMNTCIICMDNKQPCIQMRNADVVLFVKTCDCNYKVHKKCLQGWLIKNEICLICRKPMYYDRESRAINKSVLVSMLNCIRYTVGLGVFLLILFGAILLVVYMANALSV